MQMPTFPNIDLAEPLNWVFNGVMNMIASNLPLMIGVSIGISAMLAVISYAKRAALSAIH